MTLVSERSGQKRRTREAILAGARALLARGETVTVAAAAAEQDISRATAYRYFSDALSLELEAGLAVEVLPFDQIVAGAGTVRERVRAISLYYIDLAAPGEPGTAHGTDGFLIWSGEQIPSPPAQQLTEIQLPPTMPSALTALWFYPPLQPTPTPSCQQLRKTGRWLLARRQMESHQTRVLQP